MNGTRPQAPTRIFLFYVTQLVLRLILFIWGIVLYAKGSIGVDMVESFGLAHGFNFVDLCFLLMASDLATKLRPHAKIAMGSRKQYGEYHVPTSKLFSGGIRELRERAWALLIQAPDLVAQMPDLIEHKASSTFQAVQETKRGVIEAGQQFAYSIDVLRVLPWPEEDLTASERLRADIRSRRVHEIVPVIIFWVLFNLAIILLLDRFGWFNRGIVLIWSLFYFLFDMICVVLWCPLQLALMRNRCCTTCQIFNWDGIMTVTPLLFVPCWFSALLVLASFVVLGRWELAFIRHPERFDERTNASLSCVNCKDKLCYLRKPLTPRKYG